LREAQLLHCGGALIDGDPLPAINQPLSAADVITIRRGILN